MFIVRCGRGSVAASTAFDEATTNSEDSVGDAGAEESRGPSRLERVHGAISNYDSMATHLKTARRADFPALWTMNKELAPSRVDRDDVPIPDLHVGIYQYFCAYDTWSPVFASPGDFTINMDSVVERQGQVMFRIAVICCSVKALREDGPTEESTRRKAFVKFVERSEAELVKFAEIMALKYVGHRLMEHLPKQLSVLSLSEEDMGAHGDAVAMYLSRILGIKEVGYNGLVSLQEPVSKNLIVREFFDLSLGFGDPGMVSTSSCDARIEGRAEDRPRLPSAWLDLEGIPGGQSRSFCQGISPRGDLLMRTPSNLSDSAYRNCDLGSPHHHTPQGVRATGKNACIRYVPPKRWADDKLKQGAFTVEITGVTVTDGHAKYTISVLAYNFGKLEVTAVERRFSEFDAMVQQIVTKIRTLPIRHFLPAKSIFRYLSVSYLERRAGYLQHFLENLLQMRFLGILDQEISMVAEPNVRNFLQLPGVEWGLVPWPGGVTTGATFGGGLRYSGYSVSPTAIVDASPHTHSPTSSGGLDCDDTGDVPSTPTRLIAFRRRSGSL